MKKYSLETKFAAVISNLDDVESLSVMVKKYHVSKTMLHRWTVK